jgi:hypothetical protein
MYANHCAMGTLGLALMSEDALQLAKVLVRLQVPYLYPSSGYTVKLNSVLQHGRHLIHR